MEYKYDVALSFAGEDREYVDKVANILKEKKVNVFYDKFEEVDLWGKDLGLHFDYVYRRQSKYFVPFISKHYKEKVWTNYEVRTAIARAIENKEEYILPTRFDTTELDGIRSTIGYLNISKMSPEELADKILKKIGSTEKVELKEKDEADGSVYLSSYLKVIEQHGFAGLMVGVTVTNKIQDFRYFNAPYFKISQPIDGATDTFQLLDVVTPVSFPQRMEYGQQYQMMYNLAPGFIQRLEKFKGQKVTMTAHVTTTVGEKFKSNPMNVDDILIRPK